MKQKSLPFVAPFIAFIILLGLSSSWPFDPAWEYPTRVIVVSAVLLAFWPKISWSLREPLASAGIGVLVFFIWIGPDVLWPEYRSHWLFQNSFLGTVKSSVDPSLRSDYVFLTFRVIGTALLVPVIEELFWRGWLMRYIIKPDFGAVGLGAYTPQAFWLTAILFASEHGAFWDVGLMAGIVYNGWMMRTKSLADCMLAHGITNACLAAYVIGRDQWQYW